MSEVAVRQEQDEANFLPTSRLMVRAREASAAHQLATALCKTDFVPKAMKDVGNATAAIIMGDELGFTPLASLRAIYVIHGTPALYARAMVALVLSQGHEIWTVNSSAEKVEVHGRRKGSENTEKSLWTLARAQKAGYTSNTKYMTNPEEMLFSKASAEIARKIGADALLGIPFSVEDLELEVGGNVIELKRDKKTPSPAVAIARKTASENASEVDEPEFDDEETDKELDKVTGEITNSPDLSTKSEDNPEDKTSELASAKQVGYINNLAIKLGMTEREAKLAYISDCIERPVTSSKELTSFEASRVIEYLLKDESQTKFSTEANRDE